MLASFRGTSLGNVQAHFDVAGIFGLHRSVLEIGGAAEPEVHAVEHHTLRREDGQHLLVNYQRYIVKCLKDMKRKNDLQMGSNLQKG